jgi:hypothetical protein
MADLSSLLARLKSQTANPAGDNPVNDPVKANTLGRANEVASEIVSAKPTAPARTMESKLGFEFLEKVNKLEEYLLERHPLMPNLLREIHHALRQQPENVVLANEEELAIIVAGLDIQTGEELASLTVSQSKKSTGKARAAKVDKLALGFE